MANAVSDAEITTEFPRFGSVAYRETDLIVFPWGLPGFDQLKTFLILSLPNQDQLVWLQSIDDPTIAIPAADPWAFFPRYDPKLPTYAKVSLDLQKPEEFVILCVVVVPESGPMYMNLLAPLVVNLRLRVARQTPLETGAYSCAELVPSVIERPSAQAEAVAG